jgi:hypothetical protein
LDCKAFVKELKGNCSWWINCEDRAIIPYNTSMLTNGNTSAGKKPTQNLSHLYIVGVGFNILSNIIFN